MLDIAAVGTIFNVCSMTQSGLDSNLTPPPREQAYANTAGWLEVAKPKVHNDLQTERHIN